MFDKTDTQLKNSLDRINRLQIEKDVLNLINEKLKADGQIVSFNPSNQEGSLWLMIEDAL